MPGMPEAHASDRWCWLTDRDVLEIPRLVTLDRTYNDQTQTDGVKARRVNLDIGGFWVIKRTGEIERMRVCAE
jgi:hypothetical protein